jgi:M6 family metalloprotease-like protein
LPTWADQSNEFIAISPSSNYPDMTVSDYWKQMSQGNYDFIGDVYSNLVTLPPESQYISQGKNYSHANQDVLAIINTNVNWINYDKWSYNTQTQSFQFTPDGFIDMIYIIYRNPGETPYSNWFGSFDAIANLGSSFDYVTHDGKTIRARYSPTRESTGITFRIGMTTGHAKMIGLSAHEFGHYIFGAHHWNWGGIMGGFTFAMNGWERERVGYIAYTDVTQDNFTAVLGDFISEGDILRIPIPGSSTNYFLVENHQRLSHYDQIKQGGTNPGFQWNTLGAGIYILKVISGTSGDPDFEMAAADGRFDWVYDGDFWAGPGFYAGKPYEGWVPKTKRVAVNRNSGKSDRFPQEHVFWNNHWASKWCDVNEYGTYWLSGDVLGDETDAFNLGYNQIFSNWSNPSSYFNGTTNIALQVYSKNGTDITVKAFTTSSSAQNLAPSKPQFLQVEPSQNEHPYLTWDANQETDMLRYDVWKKKVIDGVLQWSFLASTTINFYEDNAEEYCPSYPQACINESNIYYKVKAVDTQYLTSVSSDSVMARVDGTPPQKAVAQNTTKPVEYSLMQNYPNPFNPTTTISYSVPKNGLVTLKVFDILGREVTSLVNEAKEAGIYSVTFNASNLPSGIYFYNITSGNFIATKKLILLK